MFCGRCGASISDGARFCPKCGFEVKQLMFNNDYQEHVKQPYTGTIQSNKRILKKLGAVLLLISGIICFIWGIWSGIILLRALVPLLSEESFPYLQYGSVVVWVSYNDMVTCLKMGIVCDIILLVIGTLCIVWRKKYKMAANALIVCAITIFVTRVVWWAYESAKLSALSNYLELPFASVGDVICLASVSVLMIIGAILNKKFFIN